MNLTHQTLVFTDLDGCLLNKADYSYAAAVPMLRRLAVARIPVILCSSKTRAEMANLASALNLADYPMTCENGGLVVWGAVKAGDHLVIGQQRDRILAALTDLKHEFAFRSFVDLGVDGVMQTTDLPRDKAEQALDRQCTEPLLWDDDQSRIEAFRSRIEDAGFTLTEGGRFWHVASSATKGGAIQTVVEAYRSQTPADMTTIAVGDSPIDQSMLDVADIPIGIPQPDGTRKFRIENANGIVAKHAGCEGWAQAVGMALDRLGIPA